MSLRQHLADEAAREALEQERKLKPLRDAEETFQRTARELAALERQRVATGKDDAFRVDDAVKDARMSVAAAAKFNADAAAAFVACTPEYYPSDRNQAQLVDFLYERNGVQIANAATFKAAFDRLHSYGLLEDWPAPEPEPEPSPIHIEPEHQPQTVQRLYDGWDSSNGEPRQYTQYEIDRMPSNEFRIAMRIPRIRPGQPLA